MGIYLILQNFIKIVKVIFFNINNLIDLIIILNITREKAKKKIKPYL